MKETRLKKRITEIVIVLIVASIGMTIAAFTTGMLGGVLSQALWMLIACIKWTAEDFEAAL